MTFVICTRRHCFHARGYYQIAFSKLVVSSVSTTTIDTTSHHCLSDRRNGQRFATQQRVCEKSLFSHRRLLQPSKAHNHCQTRALSSWIPEVMQNLSFWGGTGVVLKTLHTNAGLEYWACFSAMNFVLRISLVPLVIYSARMAARYAKVAPEVQFIVTIFQNDIKKMRNEGKSLREQRYLFMKNLQTVRGIYKLHNINPLTVFLSPFFQIPFFYYVATDLRKITNGADPALAQELTESKFLWLTDLTDPDPWYGLPIVAGAMLYFNVEMAIGRKSLSGPTASQSDFARLLKDLFQTLAVFMPCFTSQSPAGLQIYLVSSFTWTLFQSAALETTRFAALLAFLQWEHLRQSQNLPRSSWNSRNLSRRQWRSEETALSWVAMC